MALGQGLGSLLGLQPPLAPRLVLAVDSGKTQLGVGCLVQHQIQLDVRAGERLGFNPPTGTYWYLPPLPGIPYDIEAP